MRIWYKRLWRRLRGILRGAIIVEFDGEDQKLPDYSKDSSIENIWDGGGAMTFSIPPNRKPCGQLDGRTVIVNYDNVKWTRAKDMKKLFPQGNWRERKIIHDDGRIEYYVYSIDKKGEL